MHWIVCLRDCCGSEPGCSPIAARIEPRFQRAIRMPRNPARVPHRFLKGLQQLDAMTAALEFRDER